MELTLKRLLEQATFHKVRKGYDTDEVDEFLDRAVGMATKVEARLNQALNQEGGAAAPEGGAVAPDPEEVEAEVERRVAARLAEIPTPEPVVVSTGPTDEEQAEEAARTILLAQRTADAAIKEARDEAERLRSEARDEAAALSEQARSETEAARAAGREQLERERSQARAELGETIRRLEGDRDALRADVSLLESHVEEQRAQLRSSVAELQRLLEDPAGFRVAPAPELRSPEASVVPDDPEGDAGVAESDVPPDPDPGGHDPRGHDDDPSPVDQAGSDDDGTDGDDGGLSTGEVIVLGDAAPAIEDAGPAHPGSVDLGSMSPDPIHLDPIDLEDSGPPTAPVSRVDLDLSEDVPPAGDGSASDDEFLDELRRAMADQEPLGPREDQSFGASGALFDDDRRGWRFGKRR